MHHTEYPLIIFAVTFLFFLAGLEATSLYCVPWTLGICGFVLIGGFTVFGLVLGIIIDVLLSVGVSSRRRN